MPFTISHAAAALPFLRSRLNFTALVIGAMSPDFEYILMFGFSKNLSHTLPGLILFCVPAGLLFFFLYRRLWRPVLTDLSPEPLRRRMMYCAISDRKENLFNIMLSLFIGAVTHDLLDAFSHDYGWGLLLLPWLADRVPFLPLRYGELSFVVFSLLGLGLLLVAFGRWYAKTPELTPCPPRGKLFFPSLLLIVVLFGMVFMAVFAWMRQRSYDVYQTKHIAANATLGLLIYATLTLTFAGLIVYLFQRRKD